MWLAAVLTVTGLLILGPAVAPPAAAGTGVAAGPYQFVDINPDANCVTGYSALLTHRSVRVCYSPVQTAEVYADPSCASGWISFGVARDVRVCYEPDPVAEDSDLQRRCPTHPDLYICPD
jgi:hypothetical protein